MIIKKGAVYSAVITGLVILVIIVSIIAKADRTPNQVVVTFGEGKKLEIDYGQQEIQYEKILSQIYDNEFAKAGLIDWLAKKNIFSFKDPRIASALNTALCEKIPTENLSKRIEKAKECADLEISKELRNLANQKMFHFTMLVNPFE